jgi:hypothetical protein
MGRLPDGRIIHVQVTADGPHDHLARIEPHPDLLRDALSALDLLGILFHGLLHAQRRIACPHRMIFMRQWRPKQRHDAIAHDLVDGAFVAMHGRHHAFQDGVEELPGLLRVAVGQQFHRALEVGKQHRDLFAFAFEGSAGR